MTGDLGALPDWAQRLPDWVRDDELRWLAERPWIAGFIQAQDYSLDPAIERFERSQWLIRREVPATRSARQPELYATRGMETTSLRFTSSAGVGVVRGVSISTGNPGKIHGLAVPYNARSTPVIVAETVWCIEQFDRASFAPLPPSCPLRIEHDPRSNLGRVTQLRHARDGLHIAATIDTNDRQLWTTRWLRGEWSSLSIGFGSIPGGITDDWTATRDGYPLRTVRGAHLLEVSVVRSPAYPAARILEVSA